MGLLIKTDGTEQAVVPRNGKEFTLEELQGFVGGNIEAVTTRPTNIGGRRVCERIMFVNEEFMILRLPPNRKATEVIHPKWWLLEGFVGGDAIVCDEGEAS